MTGRDRARRAAALLGALLFAVAHPDARAQDQPVLLTVDASTPLGQVNHDLVGVGWHPGGQPLAVVDELKPRTVRIDASLQEVSSAPGVLDLQPLLDHVAEVRALGGEPLVILSYMPEWLGAPNAYGRDPTRVPPADLAAWEELIHEVVHSLATAAAPAVQFDAWNEPDIPIFWQDTPAAWSEMVTATASAIAQVEVETGIDLAFGGPATAVPDPVYLAAFLAPMRAEPTLPLDFVSWHYYGNTPFLGPDGNEFPGLEPVQPVIGQPNPFSTPAIYGTQIGLMREWTAGLLAGTGRNPTLIIDEWNLSPGGFDHRHDSHEGAAFTAGVLVEMQQAALDRSAIFQVDDEQPPGDEIAYGGHGLVRHDGVRKPAWWSLWLWHQQATNRLAVGGAEAADGLWATASGDDQRATVLVASFSASRPTARTLEVALDGLGWRPSRATVWRLDADHASADTAEAILLDGDRLTFELPAQGVAFLELTRDSAADTSAVDAGGRLAASGAATPLASAVLLLLLAFAGRLALARSRA